MSCLLPSKQKLEEQQAFCTRSFFFKKMSKILKEGPLKGSENPIVMGNWPLLLLTGMDSKHHVFDDFLGNWYPYLPVVIFLAHPYSKFTLNGSLRRNRRANLRMVIDLSKYPGTDLSRIEWTTLDRISLIVEAIAFYQADTPKPVPATLRSVLHSKECFTHNL